MIKHLLTLLLIAAHITCFSQVAGLVLLNGNIITLKEKGHREKAVAIKGNKILATGTDEFIRAHVGKDTKVIDLAGKTVVPGFNDVHQHPFPVYSWEKPYATLRLDTVSSMRNLIELLKRKAAVTPKGMLITGIGYNEFKLGGHPIRDSLDMATTEHPILISHASGHLSAANSLLLTLNGIDNTTPDPPGGAFERYRNNMPDGIIKETARRMLYSDKVIRQPKPSREDELDGYRIYFNDMLASGITSIGDCNVSPDKVNIYKTLVAEKFPFRFNLYINVDYLDNLVAGKIEKQSTEYLRIAGVKMFHGNSLSGKTCWLYEPYDTINPATGIKDYYGIPPARTQTELNALVLKINKAGVQIACHSNGDREIEMVITTIEAAQQEYYQPDIRHRIEHASITNLSILDRIRKDSIVPVFHSYINELGNQLMVYGEKRHAMLIPTATALEMQIPFAMHSDYPISRFESLTRLSGAVNRKAPNGKVLGPNQKIGAEDALYASTAGGAYTTHEENRKGKIIPGHFADLVILDKDPVTSDPQNIQGIRIMTTIVAGQIAFSQK